MRKDKILIADDNQFLVEILKADLELLNYEVYSAKDGEETLELANKIHPDLIILDIMMPKSNGYQVCRKIKNDPNLKNTIVIMLTAKTSPDDKLWGYDCGADEYITKPFDTDELEKLIKRKLDDKRRGITSHPITGLPLYNNFEQEQDKRFKTGIKFASLRLFYKNDCIEDIETMYGKFCVNDVLASTSQYLMKFIENHKELEPFLAFSLDNSFYLIVNANRDKSIEIGKKCINYINNLLSTIDLSKNDPKAKLMEKKQPVILMACSVKLFNQK